MKPKLAGSRPGARPHVDVRPCEALCADGRIVRIRAVGPGDGPALHALTSRSSDRSLYMRFFSLNREVAEQYVDKLIAERPSGAHLALIAEVESRLVALAGFERFDDDDEAEVALLVEDDLQGTGIGTLLLEHLASHARRMGIVALAADTLVNNRSMLGVFAHSGLQERARSEEGVVTTRLATTPDEAALLRMDAREAQADSASLQPLFAPRTVAVVGAGRQTGGVGHEVLRSILDGGYTGAVFAVNPHVLEVAGRPSYGKVTEVPASVDLAVISVPATELLAVVEDCGRAGVRAAIVLTGNLEDVSPTLPQEVLRAARAYGIRLVGPDSIGLVNTDPSVQLEAWYGPVRPHPGGLAVATQSGGLGIAVADYAVRTGLGIASIVSLGEKADVSGNDLLLRWGGDDRVRVIALYLESLGNPRKFGRLARRIGAEKPVLVVKGGRIAVTPTLHHTSAGSTQDAVVDALFRQTGVLRLGTLEEMVDAARLLELQPVPAGGRLAVIGNAGGGAVLAADAARAAGLEVVSLADLGPAATADELAAALGTVCHDGSVDAVLVVLAVTRANDPKALLRAVSGSMTSDLTWLVTVLGMPDRPPEVSGRRGAAPVFPFPESAVRALGHAVRYGRWRQTPAGTLPAFADVRRREARGIVDAALARWPYGGWLGAATARALLDCYGVTVAPLEPAGSVDEAVAAAAAMGYPLALKAGDPNLVHKSDVGGVVLGLSGEADVRRAYAKVTQRLGARDVLLQPMVDAQVELLVGVTQEPTFGPVVVLGLGGVHAEVFGDRTARVAPLTDRDAAEMVRGLRATPLLFGHRGSEPVAVAALEELLMRVSRLAEDLPEVVELDLNPVMASATGAVAVDVALRVEPVEEGPDAELRALRPAAAGE
jgi:acyl-CoA synthetase (NDP forming)/GNAT superfamily N-acetyltransferase